MTFYDKLESHLGNIYITANENAILSVSFSPSVDFQNQGNDLTKACIDQLSEYFKDHKFQFDLPLQIEGTEFQKIVWEAVKKVPYGKTASYSAIAEAIGDTKKVRAVGLANGANPFPIIIPCHRVVGKNGKLTAYSGEVWRKEWLLTHEKVITTKQLTLF